MKFPAAILISLSHFTLFAQSDYHLKHDPASPAKATFYYSGNWELTTPEKSVYKREAYFDFGQMVFDGVYKDYDKANKLIAEGFYAKGVKRGLENKYDPDHSLRSTIEYAADDFTIWELKDENKEKEIKRGTGRFTTYYFYLSGLISQPVWREGLLNGEFQSGKRVGTWTYHDISKVKTDEEVYGNGILIKRTHFSETATIELDYKKEIVISPGSLFIETLAFDHDAFTYLNQVFEQSNPYPVTFQRNITYPGGLKRLLFLLAQVVEIPQGNMFIVKIKVDEHGQVVKHKIYRSAGPTFDDAILAKVKRFESKFLPAIRNGLPYASSIYLPISGGQDWINLVNTTPVEDLTRVD